MAKKEVKVEKVEQPKAEPLKVIGEGVRKDGTKVVVYEDGSIA